MCLWDIRDAISKIESYTAVGRDEFMRSSHWQDAVIRQLEIVGAATKRLSPAVRQQYPTIPCRRSAGLRDVLIQDYGSVDVALVWEITQHAVPEMKSGVEAILLVFAPEEC